MTLPDSVKTEAEAHAAAEYPREACGLLVSAKGKPTYWPCRNLAQAAGQMFELDPCDFMRAEACGEVVGVIHSHPDTPPVPSQADRVGCETSGMPWWIVGFPALAWDALEPEGYEAPFEGREFVYGVTDCWALVRDWYAREKATHLPDFDREGFWWEVGRSRFTEELPRMGFDRVTEWEGDLQPGDVFVLCVGSSIPNHVGVYLGGNLILHHLPKRLSRVEPFLAHYRRSCTHVYRFPGAAC